MIEGTRVLDGQLPHIEGKVEIQRIEARSFELDVFRPATEPLHGEHEVDGQTVLFGPRKTRARKCSSCSSPSDLTWTFS